MEAAEALKLYDTCWFGRKGPRRSGSRGFGSVLLHFYDRCRLFGYQFLDLIESFGSEPGPSQTALLMASKAVESATAADTGIRSGFDRCDVGVPVCEIAAASKSKRSEIVKQRILCRDELVEFSVEVRVEEGCERREKGRIGYIDLGFVFSESWSEKYCSIKMECRIPNLQNDIRGRAPDYLGVWARTVASSVR